MQNSSCLRTLRSISLESLRNKRVLVRADFNVPVGKDGVVVDNESWRIKAVIPTIKHLLKYDARIILLAHLGRPGGKIQENLRLEPIQCKLSKLLNVPIKKIPDCVGKKAENAVAEMKKGEILLLENLRFYREEEQNDSNFSKKLAKLGDIYVNDAFSDSHRKHASIVGITEYLPSYAGLLMEKELKMMQEAINPKHPAIAIIGGAKIETKLPAVQNLAKSYDYVLVGGAIANELAKPEFLNSLASNIILPARKNLIKEKYFDIGYNSVKEFSKYFQKAKTIIWNGPMGKFEDDRYQIGTKGIIELIKHAHENGANVLIGGGETIYAFQKFAPELMDKKMNGFDKLTAGNFNISTGGGAMLASLCGRSGLPASPTSLGGEFLAGKELPGIEALKNNNKLC